MKELEIYVHIPFCIRKCFYCDFLSMAADDTVKKAYIEKLKEEIYHTGPDYKGRQVRSVFIGGGTPSSIPENAIASVMSSLNKSFDIMNGAEITLECNPGTLTAEKLRTYKESGINRLSIGLQSAQNRELKLLGRIHTYEDFLKSYEYARKYGFDNINVDLMSALPSQSFQSWQSTLKKVTDLKPEHISAYSLIIEEGTPFYQKYSYDDEVRQKGGQPLFLPSEEEERRMYVLTKEYLESEGYHRYEISNYAKPARECIHNCGYWERIEYAGFGLGASSLVNEQRFSNTDSMEQYLAGKTLKEHRYSLSVKEQMEEFMFLGLRMMKGVNAADFTEKFQIRPESVYGRQLDKLQKEGLIVNETDTIRLTDRGIDVSNYVFAQFLLDEEK